MAERAGSDRYSPYPTRRARQACENCRRKKSKCPGERPECSFCVRLRQRCIYAVSERSSERSNSQDVRPEATTARSQNSVPERQTSPSHVTSQRLSAVEERLQELTSALNHRILQDQRSNQRQIPPRSTTWSHFTTELRLPEDLVHEGIAIYFSNFCNQPCPILDHVFRQGLPSAHQLPTIVLPAMLALSLRSSTHSFINDRQKKLSTVEKLTNYSWSLLTEAYSDFELSDAYFQALCLLAQVDFADGKPARAQAQLALGSRLAQTRGMLKSVSNSVDNPHHRIQRHEIVWSLFMLERMFIGGNVHMPSIPNPSFDLPAFQGGPLHPDDQSSHIPNGTVSSPRTPGIVATYIEVLRIWETVIADLHQSSSDNEIPFWRHDSSRAKIVSQLLEFEMSAEHHTYLSVGPATQVLERPHLRNYYLTWLFFEIAHSSIHCCINHPFIIFMKTRQLGGRVPLTFLQKSYESSIIYANWVSKFVSEMETADLYLHDPFIGYMIGIATSIHIEHSISKNSAVASSARRKLRKCLNFLMKLSVEWPSMQVIIDILEKIQNRMNARPSMAYVEEEYDGAVPARNTPHVSLSDEDIKLMWKLFDFASISTFFDNQSAHVPNALETEQEEVPDGSANMTNTVHQDISRSAVTDGDQFDETSASNLQGTINDFESIEGLGFDWSLLGRPWMAYFPPDTDMALQ
ncbi:hypothetical protein BS50DRAFT_579334 [Corynespora cassiicola Philippines]|uniref:Zn(2)-C6 fungal-type domain-containing protein n=1 Tax=Corynespora cassiicola Philippines TaxID=1448308 RepID=A0A2T2N3Z1_CORCC|nr:hypothetical protein BS50DRAFT_579334 [Corynespora cassiicola Philippines]